MTKLPLHGKQLNIYTHIYANVLFRLLAANPIISVGLVFVYWCQLLDECLFGCYLTAERFAQADADHPGLQNSKEIHQSKACERAPDTDAT